MSLPPAAPIGRLAGRYDVVRQLGAGGMGQVFLARDVQLDRDVAVKMLSPELAADPVSRERLRREARAAAALDHPFICKVFEVTESDGQLLIVMELVIGETLHQRLAGGSVPIDEAMTMAGEIAEALEAAHDLRIVHRDLKPANVMATRRGHLKVMDFGLAKQMTDSAAETQLAAIDAGPLTDRSARVGTPAYMAPEQIAGDVVDHRSDIFALGVLLTELVTGVHPFSRPTMAATVAAVLADPPVVGHANSPGVPSPLRAVLHRMLAKSPADRYQSMRDVRADLIGLRASATSAARLLEESASVGHSGRAQRWLMVGREAERAELTSHLEEALAGRGSLIFIGGEPGIGKTRLTEDLLDEARRRGCFCLAGHCYEMEGAPPYVPFIEITERTARAVPPAALRGVLGDSAPEVAKLMPELRRMFGDIPPPLELPAEQQRRFFFNAYRDFVERSCRANPIAVVFEDLHWADEPTLQLLVHLAQSIPTLPILVIGTYRDVELDVTRPFAKVLESLLRQRLASRMALRRLPADAVTALLSAMSGRPAPASLARAIHRETEGNPFFVEEVFQHLSEEGKLFDASGAWRDDLRVESLDVPEGVRLVIGRRLERLSESTRRILTTAAVIGRTFSLTLLESLEETAGDTVLDAVEAAEAAHLLSAQTGARETRYVFAHELIRQTLAETLSLPRRQRVHAKIAAAIERVYAVALDAHVSALAHHLYQAGAASDSAKTADFLIRAADQARASAAHEEALAHLDNALSIWEGEPTDLTADVIERRAFALRSLGRPVEAVDAFGRAAAIWTKSGAHDRAAAAITESGQTRQWLMQGEAGTAELVRALRDLSRMSPGARCRVLYAQAQIQGTLGDVSGSLASIAEADGLRSDGIDPELDHIALKTKSLTEWYQMHASSSVTLAREVAAVHAARGEVWQEADALWSIPWSLFYLGRLTESAHALADYEAKAQRAGHQGARWLTSFSRAVLASAAGNLELARQEGLAALEAGRVFQIPWVYQTETFLARLDFWQGHDAEAIRVLRRIVDLEPERSYWFPSMRCGLFLALAMVEPAEALAMLRAGQVPLRKPDGPGTSGFWAALCTAVEGLARLGCREDILALVPLVEELRTKELIIAGGWTLPLATVSGIVNRWTERWDDAESDFRRAIGQMDSIPMHHLRGQSREWYADMLLARGGAGDHDHAQRLLTEAVDIYTAVGMTGMAKRVRI